MKTVSLSKIHELGINLLTGESCAFSMRFLCDVNKQGQELLEEFLGVTLIADPWNREVNNSPAVKSIMIPVEVFDPLIRFALFQAPYKYIYGQHCTYTGFNDADIENYPLLKLFLSDDGSAAIPGTLYRNPLNPSQPSEGSRNVHAFTGRTT